MKLVISRKIKYVDILYGLSERLQISQITLQIVSCAAAESLTCNFNEC